MQERFQALSSSLLSHSARQKQGGSGGSRCECLPQRDGAFIRVFIKSDGSVAVSCMWISGVVKALLSPAGYPGTVPILECSRVYEFHKGILVSPCVSPLAELTPCGQSILVPTARPAGKCVRGQKWLTYYLWIALGTSMPKLPGIASHLDSNRQGWDSLSDVDHSSWLKVYHSFPVFFGFWVGSPDSWERALSSRVLESRGELGRVRPVKIPESLYVNHEICGQGRSEKEKLIKRDKQIDNIHFTFRRIICVCWFSMPRSSGFSLLKFYLRQWCLTLTPHRNHQGALNPMDV